MKLICKILLPVLIFMITLSFFLEHSVTNVINENIVNKGLESTIIENSNMSQENIMDIIKDNDQFQSIIDKYKEAILKDGNINVNIEKEITLILDQLLPNLSSKDKENIKDYILDEQEILNNKINEEKQSSDNKTYQKFISIYSALTNQQFRKYSFIVLIVDLIILLIFEKFNTLKIIQASLITSSIFSVLTMIVTQCLMSFIKNILENEFILSIDFSYLIKIIIAELLLAFIIQLLRNIPITLSSKEKE